MQTINENQKNVLLKITHNQIETSAFNKQTVEALIRRDFAKLISNKKGEFVKITAKGKKALD